MLGAGVGIYAYHQDTKISRCTASATACSVAAALEKLPTDPHSLVPANQEGDVNTSSAVPKGSSIKVYPNTWAQVNPNLGTMSVTLYSPWPFGTNYLVSVAKQNGRWVVEGTLSA